MDLCEEIPVTLTKCGELIRVLAEALARVEPLALARWEGEGGAIVPESALRDSGWNRPEISN